jgi:hypothetical protein
MKGREKVETRENTNSMGMIQENLTMPRARVKKL